jgi:hypothetical protein
MVNIKQITLSNRLASTTGDREETFNYNAIGALAGGPPIFSEKWVGSQVSGRFGIVSKNLIDILMGREYSFSRVAHPFFLKNGWVHRFPVGSGLFQKTSLGGWPTHFFRKMGGFTGFRLVRDSFKKLH